MNTAQKMFVVSSWLFITLGALLFLVPTDFPSAQGAAWTSLGIGIFSHLGLFVALVLDQIPGPVDNPPSE